MSEADIRVRIRENSKKAVAQIKKNFAKVDKSRLRAKLSINDTEISNSKKKLESLDKKSLVSKLYIENSDIYSSKKELEKLDKETLVSKLLVNSSDINESKKELEKLDKEALVSKLLIDSSDISESKEELEKLDKETLVSKLYVEDSEIEQTENNLRSLDKKSLFSWLNVNDSQVDAAKAKLETLDEDKTVNVNARVQKASWRKVQKQVNSIRGVRGGINNADIKEKPDWGVDATHTAFGSNRRGTRGGAVMGKEGERSSLRKTLMPYLLGSVDWVGDEMNRLGSSANDSNLERASDGTLRDNGNFVKTGKHGAVPSMDREKTDSGYRSGGYEADPGKRAWKRGKEKATEYAGSVKDATNRVKKHRNTLTSLTGSIKAFGRNIGKYTPNIMMWWKLIGMLLPLIIALGVQAAGVAVAMGAIAVAGAGMIGLGLIGHGEGIADSFGLAKRQLNKFKRELFQTFKPALSEFAPISGEFMKKLPQRLEPIVDSLRGMTVFEDSFISAFNGVVDFVAEGLDRMNESAAILDQLAHRFGGIVGDEIFGFLEFLTTFAYENQDAMIELGGVFKNALITVWNLILVFSYLLASLRPLTDLIAWVSNLLGNKLVAAIAITVVTTYALTTALIQTATAIAAVQTLAGAGGVWALFSGFLTTVGSYASAVTIVLWEMVTALSAVHALTLGVGLLAAGGIGILAHNKLSTDADQLDESRRRTSGNGGGPTTINNEFYVNGDGAKSAGRELQDKFPTMYDEQQRKDGSQGSSGV